jgi:hypothetical protein
MYGAASHIPKSRREQAGDEIRHEPTRVVEVFMAGDIGHAKQVIRRFCRDAPCCVTVTPTSFIYLGGEEAGFVVGFRNYPRFPADSYTLRATAADLAERLRDELGQDSYMTVDAGGMTTWSSIRNA